MQVSKPISLSKWEAPGRGTTLRQVLRVNFPRAIVLTDYAKMSGQRRSWGGGLSTLLCWMWGSLCHHGLHLPLWRRPQRVPCPAGVWREDWWRRLSRRPSMSPLLEPQVHGASRRSRLRAGTHTSLSGGLTPSRATTRCRRRTGVPRICGSWRDSTSAGGSRTSTSPRYLRGEDIDISEVPAGTSSWGYSRGNTSPRTAASSTGVGSLPSLPGLRRTPQPRTPTLCARFMLRGVTTATPSVKET